jgi:hypothetical protein
MTFLNAKDLNVGLALLPLSRWRAAGPERPSKLVLSQVKLVLMLNLAQYFFQLHLEVPPR